MAKKRDYKKEYRDYHGTAEQKKRRASRNALRKNLGLKKGDKRHASHTNASRTGPLSKTKGKAESAKANLKRQPKRS